MQLSISWLPVEISGLEHWPGPSHLALLTRFYLSKCLENLPGNLNPDEVAFFIVEVGFSS
jgi:hypothetical protein